MWVNLDIPQMALFFFLLIEMNTMAQRRVQSDKRDMKKLVKEVRVILENEVAKGPELFSDFDVNVVLTDDWQVERFLRRKRMNVTDAAKMLIGALKWRHELRLPDLTDTYFPLEFYKLSTVFSMGKDRRGNRMIYIRVRLHHRIKEMEYQMKQFFMYIIAKVDRETRGNGMAVVFDCQGAGYSNLDLDFLWFIVSSLINHSPLAVNYILVYDLPWILGSFWFAVKGWFPEEQREKIRFASGNEILEYIDKNNLPLYLGGSCKVNYHQPPEGCHDVREFIKKHNITERVMEDIEHYFNPLLEEAEQMIVRFNKCPTSSPKGHRRKQQFTSLG